MLTHDSSEEPLNVAAGFALDFNFDDVDAEEGTVCMQIRGWTKYDMNEWSVVREVVRRRSCR